MKSSNEVLIIGAGRLGKGFIGEEFEKANWDVTFVDKNPQVIKNLAKGSYQVKISTATDIYKRTVNDYQQFLTSNEHNEIPKFLSTDIVMIPVYPEDLEDVFSYLISDFKEMYEKLPDKKLDIIVLTNKTYLIAKIYELLQKKVDKTFYQWIKSHIFIKDAIIRRSTDAKSNSEMNIYSVAVASLLIEEPLHVSLDNVNWMEPIKNVPTLKEVKVYTVNGPHATTAFFGKYKGYDTIPEAAKDSEIENLINNVTNEVYEACSKEFHLTYKEIDRLSKFPAAKNEIPDTIKRVAYDPIRKLSNNDRLCGPIQLCEKYNINHEGLDSAVAYGLKYFDKEDPNSVKMQQLIKEIGVLAAIKKITGLNDKCANDILKQYQKLDN